MKKLVITFTIVASILFNISAYAEVQGTSTTVIPSPVVINKYPELEPTDGLSFDTVADIRDALAKQDINMAEIYMQPFQVMCQNELKKSKADYNKCQYVNIIRSKVYEKDSTFCWDQAWYQFPDNYRKLSLLFAINDLDTAFPESGTYANLSPLVQDRQITKQDLKVIREHYFNKCMRFKGWYNPQRWQEGRVNSTK